MNYFSALKLPTVGLLALVVSACASVPGDGGISKVEELYTDTVERDLQLPMPGLETRLTVEDVNRVLETPLSLSDAERLSLELNPIVRAKLAQVGIAEADYAQAGRLENPGFSYERFSEDTYDASLLFDIGGLFLMPLRRQLEARRLELARYEAAAAVLGHVGNTRRAWIAAVAERQQTQLMLRSLESVETGNNLTRQMAALGHSSVREAAESEILLGEMRTALTRQRLAEGAAKEALIRQLGLWGKQARTLTLPDRLPELPSEQVEVASVEQQAIERRLDVQMARLNLEGMAKNLKLTRRSPFLSAIELGRTLEKEEGEIDRGYELELRIPIFDTGRVKTQKARFILNQAQAQAETIAIAAASSAREALAAYRSTWDIAKHYRDEVLPLRQRVSQEELLRYNGMLISVFDLLDDARSAMNMESSYVNAVKTFWLADANLQQALTGAGVAQMNFEGASMTPVSTDNTEGH